MGICAPHALTKAGPSETVTAVQWILPKAIAMSLAMPAPAPSLRRRLVLADDHLLVAQGIERLLMECFDVVALVFNGEDLLNVIRRESPDLVIADISMPGLTGIDVMRRERQAGLGGPFLFLTMHAESAMASRAICAGGCGSVL